MESLRHFNMPKPLTVWITINRGKFFKTNSVVCFYLILCFIALSCVIASDPFAKILSSNRPLARKFFRFFFLLMALSDLPHLS